MASQMSMDFVQRLYTGYYGRPADPDGLQYWAQRADQEGQAVIINAFGTSEEYQQSFGDLDNQALINNLYQQLFSRDAEQQGLEYYTGELESGERTMPEIAWAIANGASGSDEPVFETKVQAADYYTENVSSGNYDSSVGERILEQIDAKDTGADLDTARGIVDRNVSKGNATQNLEQLQQAQQQLGESQTALDEKAQELDITDEDDDGSYLDDAKTTVQQNIADLAEARAQTTDEELNEAVTQAQQAVQADSESAALQAELQSAESELEADIQSNGDTAELAGQLNNAAALYLANNDDIDTDGSSLSDVQSAAKSYLQSLKEPGAEADASEFLNAVDSAYDAIFSGEPAQPGGEPTSVLMDSEQTGTIEQVTTTLDERKPLNEAVNESESALGETEQGQALVEAKSAVEARQQLAGSVDMAQADVEALANLETQRDQDENAVAQAQESLDYELAEVSEGDQDASDEAYLFQFDADAESPVASATIDEFSSDDLLALLSEKDYSQGTVNMVEQDDGSMTTALDGNNGEFEFFTVGNENDTEIVVETQDFASVNYGNDDPQGLSVVTLTGVNSDAISADGSTISIA